MGMLIHVTDEDFEKAEKAVLELNKINQISSQDLAAYNRIREIPKSQERYARLITVLFARAFIAEARLQVESK